MKVEHVLEDGPQKRRKIHTGGVELPRGELNIELFTPSRKRDPLSNAFMGAAGKQPAGLALPSLIRGTLSSVSEHVRAASEVFPVAELLGAALSKPQRVVASRCVFHSEWLVQSRRRALAKFRAWALHFEGQRPEWCELVPEGSPTRELHLPLISFLARGLNYSDVTLVKDLTKGMDITGEIPATQVLRPRTRVPSVSHEAWLARIPASNAEVVMGVMAKQGSVESLACWNLSLKEAERGWISRPVPITTEVMQSLPLTPRFALVEEHGLDTEPKIRLIDDFKASGVNSLLASLDTCVPQGLDVFFSAISFFKLLDPNVELNTFTEDFSHACKTVGLPIAQSKFATIVLAPPDGPPHVASLRTQPFGSARAPANWGRVATFIQHVLQRVFGVTAFVYVDDVFVVEPVDTIGSAREVLKTVCEVFGFRLAPGKSQGPAKSIQLLGAEITFDTSHLRACLPARRRTDLMNDIRQILAYNQLNPGQAAKLRGRLGFSQSLLFGKVGRALLQPLTQRQYSKATGRGRPLSDELSEALRWWLGALECAPPRSIPYVIVKPVLVYTDACGAGHISAVLFVDGVRHVARTHLPEWLALSGASVFEFELAAVLFGLCFMLCVCPDRPILLCCDNLR